MITDEELMALPEEPEMAFVEFERILRESVIANIENSHNGQDASEYRLEYMNKILAASKAYELDILQDWAVPSANVEVYTIYKNFLSDVDHYTTQVRLKNVRRNKKFSVSLDTATKIKIHHFINQIKNSIEQTDLEEHKKNALYEKLNSFANEVDRSRTGWQSGMAVYVSVCQYIGEGAKKLEPVREWFDSIAELLGKAKESEDKTLQITFTEQKKLEAPKNQTPSSKQELMDDEIPF